MAVHLDIRPRLSFPAEPHARSSRRRRWRLPPLAVPALGYWLAMGALTYGFTKLGPHPLDADEAALRQERAIMPSPEPHRELDAPLAAMPQPAEAPPAVAPVLATEPVPPSESAAITSPVAANDGQEDTDKAARRQDVEGSRRERNEREPSAPRTEEPAPRLSFPEFTDSSRPAQREHAADGPRIDSLFDKAEERPSPGSAPEAPSPPPSDPDAPVAVSSCEAAIARNNEQLTIGGARGPADITREAYANILQNGRYLAACSIPARTVFEICAAVKDGHAVGITIVSNPQSPALNSCVRRAVARLKFPQNSRLDVTHTRFDAVNR